MKKALIPALSLLLLAPLAQATNMNLNLDEKCEMTLPHDMRLDKSGFTVADKGKTLMRYQDGTLVIGGKTQSLSAQQRQALDGFNRDLRTSAESAARLGLKALDLAAEVTTGVLKDVLGADAADEVEAGLAEARVKLDSKLHEQGGTWYVGAGSWDQDNDDFLGKDFEKRIERAVQKSMGNMFSQLGQAMSSGDGSFEENIQAWADNLESKAKKIEAEADAKGNAIKSDANALCGQLMAIDKQDNAFKSQFDGWVEVIEQ